MNLKFRCTYSIIYSASVFVILERQTPSLLSEAVSLLRTLPPALIRRQCPSVVRPHQQPLFRQNTGATFVRKSAERSKGPTAPHPIFIPLPRLLLIGIFTPTTAGSPASRFADMASGLSSLDSNAREVTKRVHAARDQYIASISHDHVLALAASYHPGTSKGRFFREPARGSYNICYFVQFPSALEETSGVEDDDGERWTFRIPLPPRLGFDPKEKVESEVATLRYGSRAWRL
jgi:hypothetical protein